MENQPSSDVKSERESGAVVHRRETNRQIYLPFMLGIATLLIAFLVVALPSNPVWRDRAQAMGDFLYTLLCIIPIIVCLLPVYVMILLGIYGMSKIHDGTERPLRKLENLTESLATKIETVTEYVNTRTDSFGQAIEPLDSVFGVFDEAVLPDREEMAGNEPGESIGSTEN